MTRVSLVQLLLLWAVCSCVSTGDRNVSAERATDSTLCAQHCAAVERTGCTRVDCERDCLASFEDYGDCEPELQAYYECTAEEDGSCNSIGEVRFRECASSERLLERCRAEADIAGCAQEPTTQRCNTCCSELFPEQLGRFVMVETQCVCAEPACEEACAGQCPGLINDVECADCAFDNGCETEATTFCRSDEACRPWDDCTSACWE